MHSVQIPAVDYDLCSSWEYSRRRNRTAELFAVEFEDPTIYQATTKSNGASTSVDSGESSRLSLVDASAPFSTYDSEGLVVQAALDENGRMWDELLKTTFCGSEHEAKQDKNNSAFEYILYHRRLCLLWYLVYCTSLS